MGSTALGIVNWAPTRVLSVVFFLYDAYVILVMDSMRNLPAYGLIGLGLYALVRRYVRLFDLVCIGLLVVAYLVYLVHTRAPDATSIRTRPPDTSKSNTRIDMVPETREQYLLPQQPETAKGRGTVYPPSEFETSLLQFPELRRSWLRIERVFKQETPVPLTQRSVVQRAKDIFVEHVRALNRYHQAEPKHTKPRQGTPSPKRTLVISMHRPVLPDPYPRRTSRPLSQESCRSAVLTSYDSLVKAFGGLRLQLIPKRTKSTRRAETAMKTILERLKKEDIGDSYSQSVPQPSNV